MLSSTQKRCKCGFIEFKKTFFLLIHELNTSAILVRTFFRRFASAFFGSFFGTCDWVDEIHQWGSSALCEMHVWGPCVLECASGNGMHHHESKGLQLKSEFKGGSVNRNLPNVARPPSMWSWKLFSHVCHSSSCIQLAGMLWMSASLVWYQWRNVGVHNKGIRSTVVSAWKENASALPAAAKDIASISVNCLGNPKGGIGSNPGSFLDRAKENSNTEDSGSTSWRQSYTSWSRFQLHALSFLEGKELSIRYDMSLCTKQKLKFICLNFNTVGM